MRHGKNYRDARKGYEPLNPYGLSEAMDIVKKAAYARFDETVNLTVNLGVNPKYPDQMVRGTVTLPHGTGKTLRVLVIAGPDKQGDAKDAGADFVGGPEICEKIQEGWLEFDRVIATPDMMRHVGKLGRVLGPRGLMPNPKVGTVTLNVAEAVNAAKAGQIQYKVDKYGIIHVPTGKVSFETKQLSENALTVLNALLRAKPSGAKGVYMKKITLNSAMGPAVRVDVGAARSALEEAQRSHII